MPKRIPELFLVDILIAIDKIRRNAESCSFDDFIADENIFSATMRDFEIIGEAARHLLKDGVLIKESDTEWQKIVDFRNLLIHQYFGVIPKMVFEIMHEEVPELEQDILSLLKNQKNDKNLIQAIADAKMELAEMKRDKSINYLEKIEELLKS